jgi:hypothetical protein
MTSFANEGGEYVPRQFDGKETGETRYWISFDLGLMGDYSHFYEWLDAQNAEECGSGTAAIVSSKSLEEIVGEIRDVLKETPRARAYLLSKLPDGRFGGKCVMGGRRKAPWAGFAVRASNAVEYA